MIPCRRAPSARRWGFTLLEVMVSLAILALALTAVAGINANSFEESNYARFVTVGTLLARSKMIDVEEQLRKDGLGSDDKELHGDFAEEGYPKMKWTASIKKVEIDVGQLIGGLLGGEVNPDSLPSKVQDIVGSLQGGLGGAKDAAEASKASAGGASQLTAMLGSGGLENMYKQVGETLAKSIREITLEISWGGKGSEESMRFVQYVTTSGRLAVPKGAENLPPAGERPGDRNEDTGQVNGPGGVSGPRGGSSGSGSGSGSGRSKPVVPGGK